MRVNTNIMWKISCNQTDALDKKYSKNIENFETKKEKIKDENTTNIKESDIPINELFSKMYTSATMKTESRITNNYSLASQMVVNVRNSISYGQYTIQISRENSNIIEIKNSETGTQYASLDLRHTSLYTHAETQTQMLIWEEKAAGIIDAIDVDEVLEIGLQKFLGNNNLLKSSLSNQYEISKPNGITVLQVRGREALNSRLLISNAEDERKLEELSNIYLESYPNIISGKESAIGIAALELSGLATRTENGILTITHNALSYTDNNDIDGKSWAIFYDQKELQFASLQQIMLDNLGISINLQEEEFWLKSIYKKIDSENA